MATEAEALQQVGMEIRALNPAAYKTGEWAEIIGLDWVEIGLDTKGDPIHRLCYQVIWPDGMADAWPITDPAAEYQLRGEPLVFEPELDEVPKPQRDDSDLARARRAEVPGHSWQLQFGETRLGMPDYKKVRVQCECDWHSAWMRDADHAHAAWQTHTVGRTG